MLERPGMANLQAPSRPTAPVGPNRAARRRYVKVAEAAEYLNVTDRTIRQMVADGRLTAYRSGTRLVRLDLNEIDAAMKPFGGAA
jgi:excisionase family DNA binding protein